MGCREVDDEGNRCSFTMEEVEDNNYDLAFKYAEWILYFKRNKSKYDVINLLEWTIGTLNKGYDDEDLEEALLKDTYEWIDGKADYMLTEK